MHFDQDMMSHMKLFCIRYGKMSLISNYHKADYDAV